MIGVVTDAVWMPHGRRFGRVLNAETSRTAAFPRRICPGWKDGRSLRYMGCAWTPFRVSVYSTESVGVPSAACWCWCCEEFEYNLRALWLENSPNIAKNLAYMQCFAIEGLSPSWKVLPIFCCQNSKFWKFDWPLETNLTLFSVTWKRWERFVELEESFFSGIQARALNSYRSGNISFRCEAPLL